MQAAITAAERIIGGGHACLEFAIHLGNLEHNVTAVEMPTLSETARQSFT